jgi:methylated-DNA-protein-cysteine methyltransferase related protein
MTKAEAAARFKGRVVAIVAVIPEGRVTTYGLIARHLHVNPRQVARVLATLMPEESATLPWFRVVAANGVISSTKAGTVGRRQRKRLRDEGVAVTPSYKVEDFATLVWSPTS